MSDTVRKRQVANEVLTLLRDHSPLTLEMLQRMTSPPIQKKNLRQAIGILKRKGIVEMVVSDQKTFYYQLNNSSAVRNEVALRLKDDDTKSARPLLSRRNWIHNQWCEFWALIIKKAFPEVEIIREHEIESHGVAKSILQQAGKPLDLMPDLLLIFPKTPTHEKVSIAFEIERTRKSDARIQQKLKTYIYESYVDGLIYVCDSGRLSETIRTLYQKKTIEKAHKKRGYTENFFLFSDSMSAGPSPLASFYNANGQPTSLINWCHKMRATKQQFRRDAQFMDA